ncbi:MAG: PhnD/SsuA/transferrin family substrate-binding protein, partial [Pyrinomonadaceae bacterium]
MLRRLRFLSLTLLVLSLALCADFFQTTARRAPTARGQQATQPAAATSQAAPEGAREGSTPATAAPPTPVPTPMPAPTPTPKSSEPLVIRIGVVNYNGSEKTHFDYEQILARLAQQHPEMKVSFRLVDGAYDDVLDWYKSGLLNVAILSPGVVAELLTSPDWFKDIDDLYIATESASPAYAYRTDDAPPDKPPVAAAPARQPKTGARFTYNSVCLVRADSHIRSAGDIQQLTLPEPGRTTADAPVRHKIKFFFVHSLSVSGYILPSYVLREKYGIDLSKEQSEWTYDHTQSLRELAEDDPDGDERVAFVKDDTTISGGDVTQDQFMKKFRRIKLDGLDAESGIIPQDVVLINPNFKKHKAEVQRLFAGAGGQAKPGDESASKTYEVRPDWRQQYGQ